MSSIERVEGADTFAYDANGNMTCRVEGGVSFNQVFNSENRLWVVQQLEDEVPCPNPNTQADVEDVAEQWAFTYDGDGNRVKQVNDDGKITLFLGGGIYTVEDAAGTPVITRYYSIAGQRIAMDGPDGLQYLLTDHLGSVSAMLDASGSLVAGSEQRYLPFGGLRFDPGITQTDFGFTGQRNLAAVGLMDYNARWYGQTVGAFTQPDTIVVNYINPQSLNRFSYVNNNPLRFTDPSGHMIDPCNQGCGGVAPDPKPVPICYYCDPDTGGGDGGGGNGGGGNGEGKNPGNLDDDLDDPQTNPYDVDGSDLRGEEYMDWLLRVIAWEESHGGDPSRIALLRHEASSLVFIYGTYALMVEYGYYEGAVPMAIAMVSGVGAGFVSGRKGEPMIVRRGSNPPRDINGYSYSGHAQDRMQSNGIPASAVENTIIFGQQYPGKYPNTIAYYDPINNIRVIVGLRTETIISVGYGIP